MSKVSKKNGKNVPEKEQEQQKDEIDQLNLDYNNNQSEQNDVFNDLQEANEFLIQNEIKRRNIEQNQSEEKSTLTSKLLSKLPSKKFGKNSGKENDSDCSSSKGSSISEKLQEFIGHMKSAPKFIVDNEYIFRGYRVNYNSIKKVLKSLFHIHNESVNVWSHILGALCVVMLICYILFKYHLIDIDVDGLKNKMAVNYHEKIDPIYQQFQDFDKNFNEYIQEYQVKIQENYQTQLQSIHKQFDLYFKELQNFKKNNNLEKLQNSLIKMPQNIKNYLDHLEGYDLKEQPIYLELKKSLTAFNQEYMESLVNIASNQNDKLLVLQELPLWPIYIFLLSAFLCLLFSATFHLFLVYKEQYYKYFLRLDYAGVSLLIAGSTFPPIYYGFFCEKEKAIFYITMNAVASGIVFIVSLQDFIHTQKYWTLKSLMYASLGIFAALPLLHLGIHESFYSSGDLYSTMPSLIYYLLMGFCYLGGLFVYVSRCPERYRPGQFDICGASHQIWHVSIIFAIIFTYFAVTINFHTRAYNLCPE